MTFDAWTQQPRSNVKSRQEGLTASAIQGILGSIALVGIGTMLQQKSGVNPDVAWFLEVATRVGEGAPLYLDAPGSFVEVNPPLAIWMLMPAIWLADQLGLRVTDAPALLIVAEAVVGIGLSLAIVHRMASAAWPLPWLVALVGLVLPAHDFAQREHQVVLLLAPALVALVVAPTGKGMPRWLRLAIGLSAGAAVSLKPHFVIAWALVELVVAGLDRDPRQLLRLETCAVAGFVAAYSVSVLALTPDYLRLMSVWGPLYLHMKVQSIGHILLMPESIGSVAVLALALVLRNAGLAGRAAFIFAIAAAMFVGAVVIQHKGFNYHYFPAFGFACVSVAMCIVAYHRSRYPRLVGLSAIVVTTGLLYIATTRTIVGLVLGEENRRLTTAYRAAANSRSDARGISERGFVVLSTSLVHSFPMATNIGARWPIRFPSFWVLETAVPVGCAPAREQDRVIERRFEDDLSEDLRRAAPEVIIAAPLPPSLRPHQGCITVIDHLARDPRFAAFFAEYVVVDTVPRAVHGPFVVLHRRGRKQ